MKEFGRVDYVTEVEASEIRATNKLQQTEHKKRCLITARKIEDHQTARDLGISVAELNHGGIYQ